MKRNLLIIVAVILVAAVVAGIIVLSNYTMPAPSKQIEKVIPNDRFPR